MESYSLDGAKETPEKVLNDPRSIEEILSGCPKLLVPLYESGEIVLLTDRFDYECLLNKVGAWEDFSGHSGVAQYLQNNNTGENLFLLGVFVDNVGLLSHEAAHITFFISDFVGEEVTESSANESFCHLLQKIVDWAYPLIEGVGK